MKPYLMKRSKVIKSCLECGKEFYAHYSSLKKHKRFFCSKKCMGIGNRAEKSPCFIPIGKPFLGSKGSKNAPRNMITVNGKIMIHARYVMEQHLGRKLKSTEVVHHKNHKETDDRLENLQIMTHGEHIRHHHSVDKINVKCAFCSKPFKVFPCRFTYSKRITCSRSCASSLPKFKTQKLALLNN